MPITDDVRDKIKKLHALAEGGAANEKDVAATKRDELLKKHGVTLDEALNPPRSGGQGGRGGDPWSFFYHNGASTEQGMGTEGEELLRRMRDEMAQRAKRQYDQARQRDQEARRRHYVKTLLRQKYTEQLDEMKSNPVGIAEVVDALLEGQQVITNGLQKLEGALEHDLDTETLQRVVGAMVKTQREQLKVNRQVLLYVLAQCLKT